VHRRARGLYNVERVSVLVALESKYSGWTYEIVIVEWRDGRNDLVAEPQHKPGEWDLHDLDGDKLVSAPLLSKSTMPVRGNSEEKR